MNPEPSNSLTGGLELASELLSLLAAGILVYRLACPDGPEPLELVKDAYRSGLVWLREQRTYRRAMQNTLDGIRDLPETEGTQ